MQNAERGLLVNKIFVSLSLFLGDWNFYMYSFIPQNLAYLQNIKYQAIYQPYTDYTNRMQSSENEVAVSWKPQPSENKSTFIHVCPYKLQFLRRASWV